MLSFVSFVSSNVKYCDPIGDVNTNNGNTNVQVNDNVQVNQSVDNNSNNYNNII